MTCKFLTKEEQQNAPIERLFTLTPEEEYAVIREIRDDLIVGKKAPRKPKAVFIIGQPGSGKSTKLTPIAEKMFKQDEQDFCRLDYDELRLYHPYKDELIKRGQEAATSHISQASRGWFSEMLTMAYMNNMNIIIDMPSLFTNDAMFATSTSKYANMLKSVGYQIDVHAMAVAPEKSYLGCIKRTTMMHKHNASSENLQPIRIIGQKEHDMLSKAEVTALTELQMFNMPENIYVWNREDTTPLLHVSKDNMPAYEANSATDALVTEREKPLSGKEYMNLIGEYKDAYKKLIQYIPLNNSMLPEVLDMTNKVINKHYQATKDALKNNNVAFFDKIKKSNNRD